MPIILNGTSGITFPDTTVQVTAVGQLQTQLFASSGDWTCPAGVTKARVTVIGGGGGGAYQVNFDSGSGGGPGGSIVAMVNVTPATVYVITRGTGGTASVTASGGTAGSGSTSSFSNLVTATGGTGASGSNGTVVEGIAGTGSTTQTLISASSGFIGFLKGPGAQGGQNPSVFSATAGNNGAILVEWIGA